MDVTPESNVRPTGLHLSPSNIQNECFSERSMLMYGLCILLFLCGPIQSAEFRFLLQFDIVPTSPNSKQKDRNQDVVNYISFSVSIIQFAYSYYYSVDHLTNPNCFLLPGQGCCAIISITRQRKELTMIIEVDFDSDEAIYIQLCNQIIMGIATSVIHEGDSLPSVRQLADTIGVNMHTVNKAYSVLKREGYISLDKRRGAVIALDIDKMEQLEEMRRELKIVLARGCCKNISRREVHDLVDEIFDDYE